jgi:hypothetical protein
MAKTRSKIAHCPVRPRPSPRMLEALLQIVHAFVLGEIGEHQAAILIALGLECSLEEALSVFRPPEES